MHAADVDAGADRREVRFTMHVFKREYQSATGPSGTILRTPADMSTWPPNTLFHAVYASAVVKTFGFELEATMQNWRNIFYPDGPIEAAHADDQRLNQAIVDKEKKSTKQKAERQAHLDRRDAPQDAIDFHDVVMMYRCSAMEPEAVREYVEGCKGMRTVEHKGLEEKVNSWRESLGPPTVIGTD